MSHRSFCDDNGGDEAVNAEPAVSAAIPPRRCVKVSCLWRGAVSFRLQGRMPACSAGAARAVPVAAGHLGQPGALRMHDRRARLAAQEVALQAEHYLVHAALFCMVRQRQSCSGAAQPSATLAALQPLALQALGESKDGQIGAG